MAGTAPSSTMQRLEEDFHIVRRSYPDVARSMSTSSNLSTPKLPKSDKDFQTGRLGERVGQGRPATASTSPTEQPKTTEDVKLRLERLETLQRAASTEASSQKEESLALASAISELRVDLAELKRELTGCQDVSNLRSDVDLKCAQQQASLSAIQAQCEQTRLQVSELRSDVTAIRERQDLQTSSLQSDFRRELDAMQLAHVQANHELRLEASERAPRETQVAQEQFKQLQEDHRRMQEEFALKIMELAGCVDEVARQMQDQKQDFLAESMLLKSKLQDTPGDYQSHFTRLENLEAQQREEQARLNTESAALKARLQALELRLAAAALEKISAQASSAHKAQESLEVRLARLEAVTVTASAQAGKVVPLSSQGAASTAAISEAASAPASVASAEDARGHGLAHLVGEMDAELRVELNSRLRSLTADLKGEIMSDVAARIAAAEAAVGGIEAKLSSDLDNVCEDFRACLESLNKAELVPRMKTLEDQVQRTNLVLSTIQEAKSRDLNLEHRRERSQDARPEAQAENKAKLVISSGLRQRIHGLVSALSWTLGQVPVPTGENGKEGMEASPTASRRSERAPDAAAFAHSLRPRTSTPALRPDPKRSRTMSPTGPSTPQAGKIEDLRTQPQLPAAMPLDGTGPNMPVALSATVPAQPDLAGRAPSRQQSLTQPGPMRQQPCQQPVLQPSQRQLSTDNGQASIAAWPGNASMNQQQQQRRSPGPSQVVPARRQSPRGGTQQGQVPGAHPHGVSPGQQPRMMQPGMMPMQHRPQSRPGSMTNSPFAGAAHRSPQVVMQQRPMSMGQPHR